MCCVRPTKKIRTKELLDRGSIRAAVKILYHVEKSLKECSKIIRIADKLVLEEYIDDLLTENTDDATKVRQTEHSANIKRREKARQSQRINPYHRIQ